MQRRQLIQNGALALSASALSCAVHPVFAQATTPKDQGRPFRSVSVPEDSRLVIFFFDFACRWCATYHEPFHNFSNTVPRPVQASFIPVVNVADKARLKEQVIAANCFYSASQIASKDQMRIFARTVYREYPESRSLEDKSLWMAAIRAAGIDIVKFGKILQLSNNQVQITYAAKKMQQYALKNTPSVGIGGKYVITPDDVLGDQSMFFNILNGLTSEIL